jgi:hypothetical protein
LSARISKVHASSGTVWLFVFAKPVTRIRELRGWSSKAWQDLGLEKNPPVAPTLTFAAPSQHRALCHCLTPISFRVFAHHRLLDYLLPKLRGKWAGKKRWNRFPPNLDWLRWTAANPAANQGFIIADDNGATGAD